MSDSQVPFATLGNAIGFISKLSGSVTIQSIDGQERVVKIGDPIFFGETVVTGANSSVTIAFIDGTEVVIGGDSVVEITDEIYNSGDNQDLVADSSTDIDALMLMFNVQVLLAELAAVMTLITHLPCQALAMIRTVKAVMVLDKKM